MMPGFASVMLAGGAGAGSVVPSPADWDEIDDDFSGATNAAIVIEGITEPILLRMIISAASSSAQTASLRAFVDGALEGSCAVANGSEADFEVAPGQAVHFGASGTKLTNVWSFSGTATIKYRLAGSSVFDQTLDTFPFAITNNPYA